MAKYELVIACCDEPEAHRKKEGDVIGIAEAGHQYSAKERKEYLVIPIETNDEIEHLLESEVDANGDIIKKRKHSIPLATIKSKWCATLDETKVRDKNQDYQPLKDEAVEVKNLETYDKVEKKVVKTTPLIGEI